MGEKPEVHWKYAPKNGSIRISGVATIYHISAIKIWTKKCHRLNQQSCSFRTNTVLRNASWGLISGFCGYPDGRINNPWQIGKDFPQTSSIHTNTLTSAEKRSLRVLAHWQSLTKTGPAVSQHAINVSIQNPLHPDIQSFWMQSVYISLFKL